MGIIADMKAFRKLLKKTMKNLNSYSKRCQSRINRQSPVSSYHTIREAQILTVKSTETDAESLENLRQLIKNEIEFYQTAVNRMYVRNWPRLTRVHYQSKQLEKSFMDEYSKLSKAREGKSGQGTSSDAEKTYRENLTRMYRQGRKFEEERLNAIRNVLVSFVKAIHSVPHIGGLNQSYQELINKIGGPQSTQGDLDFWARTYGISLEG